MSPSQRANYGTWVESGEKSFSHRARQRIEEILGEHKPASLANSVQMTIQEIVGR
jgi:trimethylamine:corrinoid methyltransferase-like protein